MLSGFPLVFSICVGLLFAFFGAIWNREDFTNACIKVSNFVMAFASVYVVLQCTTIPIPYLVAVGGASLVGAVAWRTDSGFNIGCKVCLVLSASVSAILVLFR